MLGDARPARLWEAEKRPLTGLEGGGRAGVGSGDADAGALRRRGRLFTELQGENAVEQLGRAGGGIELLRQLEGPTVAASRFGRAFDVHLELLAAQAGHIELELIALFGFFERLGAGLLAQGLLVQGLGQESFEAAVHGAQAVEVGGGANHGGEDHGASPLHCAALELSAAWITSAIQRLFFKDFSSWNICAGPS